MSLQRFEVQLHKNEEGYRENSSNVKVQASFNTFYFLDLEQSVSCLLSQCFEFGNISVPIHSIRESIWTNTRHHKVYDCLFKHRTLVKQLPTLSYGRVVCSKSKGEKLGNSHTNNIILTQVMKDLKLTYRTSIARKRK